MKLYNTLTKKVEKFIPNEEGKVKMYTCGPTVYHFAHIGNLRTYISEDVLEKGLKFIGESFYGRIANVLLFNDLSEYDIRKIIDLKTGEMEISTEIVDKIILESDYKKFGARKIESLVEDRISLMIEV